MIEYSFSAVCASMRFIAPLGRLCSASSESCAWAITSTIALPIAVTSNRRVFIRNQSSLGLCGLQVLTNEGGKVLSGLCRNGVRPGDEGVLERRSALARALVRQRIDRPGDDLLR